MHYKLSKELYTNTRYERVPQLAEEELGQKHYSNYWAVQKYTDVEKPVIPKTFKTISAVDNITSSKNNDWFSYKEWKEQNPTPIHRELVKKRSRFNRCFHYLLLGTALYGVIGMYRFTCRSIVSPIMNLYHVHYPPRKVEPIQAIDEVLEKDEEEDESHHQTVVFPNSFEINEHQSITFQQPESSVEKKSLRTTINTDSTYAQPLHPTEIEKQKEQSVSDIISYIASSSPLIEQNKLFNKFQNVISTAATFNSTHNFPFFWLIPPYLAGGHRYTRISNECFDLTRADITKKAEHQIMYQSQQSSNREQLLVGSNLFEVPNLFQDSDSLHKRGQMFAFFLHPIQRSAYMIQQFQLEQNRPFAEKFKQMSVKEAAEFLLYNTTKEKQEYIYRASNWLTRSLSQTPFPHTLTKEHVHAASLFLKQKCIVGLFHDIKESIKTRLLPIFHWDLNAPGGALGIQQCLSEFIVKDQPFVPDLVYEGSDEWEVLKKLNEFDLLLYDNILDIYREQGHLIQKFHTS